MEGRGNREKIRLEGIHANLNQALVTPCLSQVTTSASVVAPDSDKDDGAKGVETAVDV